MSAIEELEQFAPPLPTIEDYPIVGIHEYFVRQMPEVSEALTRRRVIGLQAAMLLTDLGVFDSTPRVYGATEHDELLIFPHYKLRTMPRFSAEKRAELEREIQLGLRGKDEDNLERTKFGLWLAKRSLDDAIPFPVLMGTHQFFGNVRPIMPAELFSVALTEAAEAKGMSILDVARQMKPGFATIYAWLGARTWNPEQLVEAVTLEPQLQPSKRQLLKAVANKDFLQQTGSPQVVEPKAA